MTLLNAEYTPKSILLVSAPFLHLYGGSTPGVSYYFPLGIGYIASNLEKQGYTVKLIAESEKTDVFRAVEETLRKHEFLLVGISSMTPAFPSAVELAQIVRRLAPRTAVVLGGPHASAIGSSVLEEYHQFDFLCVGEGEAVTLELVKELEKGSTAFGGILGLTWRDNDSKVIQNQPRPFLEKIDELPYPARHLVNFKDFSLHTHVSLGEGLGATMVTSRGCPFDCIFCSARLTHGRRYRLHSDDYVINEIRLLRDRYGVKYIFFEDDTFTVVKNRVARLCNRIVKERIDVTFGCFSRVDVFDEEMARTIYAAGCRLVIFGIESGVPETLEKMRKRISIENSKKAISLCRKNGIKALASFVVGLPFETRDQIQQTISFGKSLNASVVTFNPFVPYPGTPLYDPEKHKPAKTSQWETFLTTAAPPFDMTPGVSAKELKAIVDRAHLEYYLNPRRLLAVLTEIRSGKELLMIVKAFLSTLRGSLRERKSRTGPSRST